MFVRSELKKNLGVVTIDTNVLHESLKYFHSIIETRSTSIVSDFSKYSQLLTALNTFSVFTQVENISFKEDTVTISSKYEKHFQFLLHWSGKKLVVAYVVYILYASLDSRQHNRNHFESGQLGSNASCFARFRHSF